MNNLDKWRDRSVLVVDDSPSSRLAAVELLRDCGFSKIHEADDGHIALMKLAQIESVDLLLTDLNMPEMDGIELLGALVASPPSHPLFVAVMSGVARDVLDSVQGIAEASMLELLAVLPKPLQIENLRAMLDNCDPDEHRPAVQRQDLTVSVQDLEQALQEGQLQPYFQPKLALAARRLVGFEALVRWIHPEHGVLPPAVFVHHLEFGDLALRFFYRFVDLSCAMMGRLPATEPGTSHPLNCSVNLPVPLLGVPQLVEDLERIVSRHGLSNETIVLELTETTLMSNLGPSLGTLARLRMKGFGIAMDDYGTGYSSMKQLSRCPFSELKIDREFVHDAVNSTKKLAILTTAISMCQRLGIISVAEGVETESDWQQLVALGCDVAQGYLISRPMSEASLMDWLAEHTFNA